MMIPLHCYLVDMAGYKAKLETAVATSWKRKKSLSSLICTEFTHRIKPKTNKLTKKKYALKNHSYEKANKCC